MFRRLTRSAVATIAATAACALGAISILSGQAVEAPRPAPAKPAAPAPASQPTAPAKPAPASRPAARPAAPAAPAAPKVAFEKHVLPNGLQLILHVDRKLPIVHVNQWFHVGSKNEKPRRTGFAHLFEHLMFQGSTHVPGEYFSLIEKMGANIREGGVNGTTNTDRTNYFATVPSANLENAAVGRVGPAGDAARRDRSEEAGQPARRRQERAPPGLREPAVRPLAYEILTMNLVAGRPSLLVAGHRQHGGSDAPRRSTT